RAIVDELELSNAHVVHPGVEVERFVADREPEQPPEILVLGALTPWKRPDLALEVCAAARRERPDVRLRFAGAPLDERGERLLGELHRRAAQSDLSGAVTFVGAVE